MPQKNSAKILIAEDEEGIRDLLKFELGLKGYSVKTAADGQEAVDLVTKEKFDVFLCDIKMPKFDGVYVLKESKKQNPDTIVLMMTGYGEDATYRDCKRFGASGFISKPFHMDEVVAAVEKALEGTKKK